MFKAQVLLGPSIKLHKEIIQIENNMIKNPNWQEADQLAIYKRGRIVELGATKKQLQLAVRAGLEPGTTGFRVRRPNHSTMLPPWTIIPHSGGGGWGVGCGGWGGGKGVSSITLTWFELPTPGCAHLGCLWLMCNFTFTIFYYVVISV